MASFSKQPAFCSYLLPTNQRRRSALAGFASALLLFAATVAPAWADSSSYRVAPGDTLGQIAQRFGLSPSALVTVNHLADPDFIEVGQLLRLPGGTMMAPLSAPSLATPIIQAPYLSQFDGTVYEQANCGPTALAMALDALGVPSNQIALRHLAERQMGINDPNDGTTWESLAYVAHVMGVKTSAYKSGKQYLVWSFADLTRQFDAGHPVLLLVRYRQMPGHETSDYWGDHYVVGLGFDADGNLIYHDPATRDGSGAFRSISRAQLLSAWSNTAIRYVRTAMALE
ncbi:MAG TPA: C39 family peptidase, partial [Chloroflexota bacterium]|nr:C39 family peptidase [Chloroflexota bacterium]